MNKELNFYKQPFYRCEYSFHVFDANDNFVFQFFSEFDGKDEYDNDYLNLQDMVMDSLNCSELIPIPEIDLACLDEHSNMIALDGKPFILIRGWGNLTGTGAHNFSVEKASKIQDDFNNWIIYKLTGK